MGPIFPRNHYRFTIYFAISIWIHYLIPEITMNTLFFSRNEIWIHNLLRNLTLNSLSSFRNHYQYNIYLQNQFWFTICFAISLWIHSIFSNSLSVLRIHLESTILFKPLWFWYEITMKSLWIHYLLHAFTKNSSSFSRMHYLFRKSSMNSLFFPNSLWIHYLLRYFNMNTISFANSPWIHDLLRNHYDFAMKSLLNH